MKSNFQLKPINLEGISSTTYDLAIYALGYEQRATQLVKSTEILAQTSISYGFNYGKTLSFSKNRNIFNNHGIKVVEDISDEEFEIDFKRQLISIAAAVAPSKPCQILIDISCFNRFRLAAMVNTIRQLSTELNFIVDFFYSLARYSDPSHSYTPNEVVKPVHPSFSGWSTTPANPTAAIVGLGYEQDQALGIVEYLQANPVWLFSPNSAETRYMPAVRDANKLLLEELDDTYIIQYEVDKPIDIFQQLEGMIRGLQHDHNVVIVPFGPKIIVLCSLLASWRHPTSAVWRVSAGARIAPQDRKASKYFCLLRMETSVVI